MAVDRTAELKALCRAQPRGGGAPTSIPPKTPPYVRDFSDACAEVGRRAARTKATLAQLREQLGASSLFRDPSEKIAHLIGAAGEELSAAAGALQMARRTHLEPNRPPAGRKQPLAFQHVAAIEAALKAELERLTRELQSLMRDRSEAVRRQAERAELYGAARSREDAAPARSRVPVFDALPRPGDTVASGNGVSGVGRQMQQLIPEDTYAQSRADASAQIEAQVAEVSSIFGRVTQLIKDQGESVERIEVNVEAAAADVEGAQEALLTKLNSMSSTTATALKVGGIVCATLVAYVLIV